jgi:SnoaL-like domain
MGDPHAVIAGYWSAVAARDWDGLAAVVAPDVRYEVPQTRERVRGRDAFVRFTRDGFPGDWRIEISSVVGEGRMGASRIIFTGESGPEEGLCFFTLDGDGLIATIADYWPEPYEPPAGRGHLVERY